MTQPSTKDKTADKFHEVKGQIKEAVGKVTNAPDLEVSGKAEKAGGKVQKWIGRAEKAGFVVAAAIKQVKPDVPVVMVAEDVELPKEALKSVDALVAKSDGPHFLLATVHSVLSLNRAQRYQGELKAQTPGPLPHLSKSRGGPEPQQARPAKSATAEASPFSSKVWRSIRDGTIQF